MNKNSTKDALLFGFALFAMFFGAGNLIFPPELGLRTGSSWMTGFLGFFLADVGLSILGVFAAMKCDGNSDILIRPIGKFFGTILIVSVILCLGPALAIPRTAAVTYSLGFAPIFNLSGEHFMISLIFSIAYFAIVWILSIKPSAVVDVIGKFLTPILVVCMVILIIMGLVNPKASPAEPVAENVIKAGIISGYQTMDAMGAALISGIVVLSIYQKGYKKGKEANRVNAIASSVVAFLLFIVYGGLDYLGASTGSIWKEEFLSGQIDQAGFLSNIVRALMGYTGVLVIGVIVLMACLTTAIALVATAGNYFSDLSKGKVKYETVVTLVCVFSTVVANIGLSNIINFSIPILVLLYPVIVFLMLSVFFHNRFRNKNIYRFGAAFAFLISFLSVCADIFKMEVFSFVHVLPLNAYGLNWILPSLLGVLIGYFISAEDLEPIE